MELISVKKASKYYGKLKVVDDVDITIDQGEIFGLAGESGSGKTTLARIILQLIPFAGGEITYLGGFSRKDYQIVFQNPYASLDPRMRIKDALEEPLMIHGVKKDIKELLSAVELNESFMDRYPHELSGGERQRICIARAISIDPKFIVLDEPVSSLDMTVQLEMLKLLKGIQKRLGLTLLMIAHDLSVIKFMCDKVAIMKTGRIIESGYVKDVYEYPKDRYTRLLLDSIPKLSADLPG